MSSLSREVGSGLQRVEEAGHRPLAVRGASCGDLVQRQVLDTAGETTRARDLKFTTTTQLSVSHIQIFFFGIKLFHLEEGSAFS